MKPPHNRITALVKTMTSQLDVPVSVKVRIGVDSYDDYPFFRNFIEQLHVVGGCNRFVVHARKALLDGISTRQNRVDELVPLRHDWVYRLKHEMPQLHIEINGGIKSIDDMHTHLAHPCGLNGM
ncbi:hypothetical protein DYB32_009826 [Aphanomyces invadans]|uniref:DUS-like FMN-binding domain-containing protein n=1 Tax=Aphanomyces invadans TaxID=157072 RepID=A0A3R6YSW6_9STRA|nr:hypothetical protein DYB32_009826 [Aphanomyces invadans]